MATNAMQGSAQIGRLRTWQRTCRWTRRARAEALRSANAKKHAKAVSACLLNPTTQKDIVDLQRETAREFLTVDTDADAMGHQR